MPINLLLMKGQTLVGSMGTSRGDKIQQMFDMVQSGKLRPFVESSATYSLENFAQGFDDLANRRAVGKVIIYTNGPKSKL